MRRGIPRTPWRLPGHGQAPGGRAPPSRPHPRASSAPASPPGTETPPAPRGTGPRPRNPAGPAPRRAHLRRRFLRLALGQKAEPSSGSGPGRGSLGPGLLGVPHHLAPGQARRRSARGAATDTRDQRRGRTSPRRPARSTSGPRQEAVPVARSNLASSVSGARPRPPVEATLAAGAGAAVRLRLSELVQETPSRGIALPGSAPPELLVFVGQQFVGPGLGASRLLPRCSLRGRRNAVGGVTSRHQAGTS